MLSVIALVSSPGLLVGPLRPAGLSPRPAVVASISQDTLSIWGPGEAVGERRALMQVMDLWDEDIEGDFEGGYEDERRGGGDDDEDEGEGDEDPEDHVRGEL